MNYSNSDALPKDAAVYCGFDPTARSLHVGNLLALVSLLHFSISGFPTIALVGGATGRIGDPSWRSTAKERLGETLVEENTRSLTCQIGTFLARAHEYIGNLRSVQLDHEPLVLNQWEWYEGLGLINFLDEVGRNVRVASMIQRDSVKGRFGSENGLSFAELTYQLMQAYDFLHLNRKYNCQLQVGGSDQWGNIVAGIDLIHRINPERPAHGLTLPLLTTGEAGEKMGKSAGNAKWLDPSMTSLFDLYQYFMDMSDSDAVKLLPILSFRPSSELNETIEEHLQDQGKQLVQKKLAFDVTALVHSETEASKVQTASELLFGQHQFSESAFKMLAEILKNSQMMQPVSGNERIVDILSGPETSKNSIKILIRQGGVSLNGIRLSDPMQSLSEANFNDGFALLKYGKQSFKLLGIKTSVL